MTISSRFSVAVHILALLEMNKEKRITSEFIAGSVNTNPVVIRRIIGMLNKAGLVRTNPGIAGAELAKEADQVTLLDVYRAVQAELVDQLFAIHEHPNPQCLVGRNIQGTLETSFYKAQNSMERELAGTTVRDIIESIQSQG